jgi:hypothetical protein
MSITVLFFGMVKKKSFRSSPGAISWKRCQKIIATYFVNILCTAKREKMQRAEIAGAPCGRACSHEDAWIDPCN